MLFTSLHKFYKIANAYHIPTSLLIKNIQNYLPKWILNELVKLGTETILHPQ